MTYGIGGAIAYEEEGEGVERPQTWTDKVQAAYEKLYPTTALVKRTKYWEGYADALRDVLEELV